MATSSSRSAFTNEHYGHDLSTATCDPQEVFNSASPFSAGSMQYQDAFHSEHISRTPPNSTRPPSLIMESSSSEYSDFASSPSQASSFDNPGSSRRSSAYAFPSSPCPAERPVLMPGLDSEPWVQMAHHSHEHGVYGPTAGLKHHGPSFTNHSQWSLGADNHGGLDHCAPCGTLAEVKSKSLSSRPSTYSHGYHCLSVQSLLGTPSQGAFQHPASQSMYSNVVLSPVSKRQRPRKQGTVRYGRKNRVAKSSKSLAEGFMFQNEKIVVTKQDDKIHRCSFQGCTQRFAREEHRKRHERNHLPPGEKQLWKCPLDGCTKNSSGSGISDRRDNLTQHLTKTHGTWTSKKRGHTNKRFTMRQILEDATKEGCYERWLSYFQQDKGLYPSSSPNFDVKAEIRRTADKQRWVRLLKNEMEWDTRENKKTGHAAMTGYWKLLGWSMEEALHIKVVDIAPEYTNSVFKGNPNTTLDKIHPMWKAMRRGELTVTQCQKLWDPVNNPDKGMSDEDHAKTRYFLQYATLDGYPRYPMM